MVMVAVVVSVVASHVTNEGEPAAFVIEKSARPQISDQVTPSESLLSARSIVKVLVSAVQKGT
jgi:hypothetical protein